MSDRRIVYIRATDRRPLYIFSKRKYEPVGKYFLIDSYYSPSEEGGWIKGDPYFLRVGDQVRVRYINPDDKRVYVRPVDIDIQSRFTDEPNIRIKDPSYLFA